MNAIKPGLTVKLSTAFVIGCLIDNFHSSGNEPMDEIIFAKNLGLISDRKFGPDGALYVISLMEGKIYKIST